MSELPKKISDIRLWKMKLLFIVNIKESESDRGGLFLATHHRIKKISEILGKKNVEVYCLNKYDSYLLKFIKRKMNKRINKKNPSESFTYDGIRYKNYFLKNSVLRELLSRLGCDGWYIKKKAKKIDTRGIDIVSAHWGHPQGSLAYYLKKIKGLPYTLTLHGSDVHTNPKKNKGFKKFLLRNIKNADKVFFVSRQLKKQALDLGWIDKENKGVISYNAVDPSVFYQLPENFVDEIKEREQTKRAIVGYVGNLNKIKRADYLVEIYNSIQSKIDFPITFYVIGDGELKELIKNKANRMKGLDIRITGRVSQESLRGYYNIFDCLILPSKNEGLGNVIMEAQSCGTPVVATNVGGIPEIICNKNHLVKNDDSTIVEEISQKVIDILASEIKINNKNITWEEIVRKELSVIRKII